MKQLILQLVYHISPSLFKGEIIMRTKIYYAGDKPAIQEIATVIAQEFKLPSEQLQPAYMPEGLPIAFIGAEDKGGKPHKVAIEFINTLDPKRVAAAAIFCTSPKMSDACLKPMREALIARGIKAAIGTNPDWETQYRNADGWDQDNLFGADMGDLHDVDRKYLYSFWKNCFGNDQQLFLIFVRAEPTVMGGSSAGHTPSQLGARAVALVWREPTSSVRSSTGTVGVHRMRILFYHQFEQ